MPKNKDFTLIAHRGASYDAPENTFEAFDLALELGFDNFETDVQLTRDGTAVMVHDDTLNRTTDGTGLVAETTIAKIKSLNAGLWFEGPEDGAGIHGPLAYSEAFVPTLDEFLERYAGRAHVHLELKSTEPELAATAMKSLKEKGWLDQHTGDSIAPGLTISSFRFEQLERSVALMPNIAHGWLLQEIDQASLKAAVELGLSGIYPNAGKVTRQQITDANAAGLVVRTWGIANSKAALKRAYQSGALGTTVDWPAKAREIIGSL
ncbi:MAG: glycerophosphodiester phosphodiesterase family protein [Dehalococcoidia bacterium]|jgi:glycerophosphoryl diester phosphodiesterase|nr:glycerophosphodiester phosphodiesterase family protein [Dehalococcoidia bacterium]